MRTMHQRATSKVDTGFASDRALNLNIWRMIMSANRKPTSRDHALTTC